MFFFRRMNAEKQQQIVHLIYTNVRILNFLRASQLTQQAQFKLNGGKYIYFSKTYQCT